MIALRRTLGFLLANSGALALYKNEVPVPSKPHSVDVGPMEVKLKKKSWTLEIPAWAGGAALVAGLALLLWPAGSKS